MPARAPLDPDAQALLTLLSVLKMPPYETMTPQAARALAAQLVRNARTPKVGVGAVEDLSIDTGGQALRLRHYRPLPPARDMAVPALVFFHGGGWVMGDLESHDHLCRTLARDAGIAVLAVDYPLAPEHPFPAPLEAAAAAWRWIVAEAGALRLDPARIGVGGDSAGGNLAAVLALMARDGALPPPRVQCLIYPALDLSRPAGGAGPDPSGLLMQPATMDWFVDCYVPDRARRTDWRASPLRAPSLAGVAPAFVLTAGHDVLHAEGAAYAARLKDEGVPVTHRDFPGQLHHFVALPHALPTAHVALSEMTEFLLRDLRGLAPA